MPKSDPVHIGIVSVSVSVSLLNGNVGLGAADGVDFGCEMINS
jgi:hypothetical protein